MNRPGGDEELFSKHLEEVRVWCHDRARLDDPKWSLRSSILAPRGALEDDSDGDPSVVLTADVVDDVVSNRSEVLRAREPLNVSNSAAARGTLLACRFENSNQNYASAEYSHGLFDGNDIPPWDCWIDIVDWALVSWIPSSMSSVAQAGMDAEIFETLSWVHEDDALPAWLRGAKKASP